MTESRAILHLVTDVSDEGLEDVVGEYREVALRMRRLLAALEMTHEGFAKATLDLEDLSTGLRRTEISVAVNGGQLAKTSRWTLGVARAAKVDRGTADDYLRGKVSIDELMRRRGGVSAAPPQPTLVTEDLSPNKRKAMGAFDWEGCEPEEYEFVHHALAAEHFATGIDAEPSYWMARIAKLLTMKRSGQTVPQRVAALHRDLDEEESPEVAEYRKTQAAKRTPKKKTKK